MENTGLSEIEQYRIFIREQVGRAIEGAIPPDEFERDYLRALTEHPIANLAVDEKNAGKYPVLLEEAYREVYARRWGWPVSILPSDFIEQRVQFAQDHEMAHARGCRGGYFLGVAIGEDQMGQPDVYPYFGPKGKKGLIERAKISFAPMLIGQRLSSSDLRGLVGK